MHPSMIARLGLTVLVCACAPTKDPSSAPPPQASTPSAEHRAEADADADADDPEPTPDSQVDATADEGRPEAWPAPLPWFASPYPAHTEVVVSPAGDHFLRMTFARAPVAELARPWQEALAALQFGELDACSIDPSAKTLRCVYQGPERRASLNIGPDRDEPGSETSSLALHLLPPGHTPLQTLPGPCVVPPQRERRVEISSSGVDQQGERRSSSQERSVGTYRTFDLDGDGNGDTLVPAAKEGSCPWDIPREVYIMRGECGHYVGSIAGDLDAKTGTAAFVSGLRTLVTDASWADFHVQPTGADDPVTPGAGKRDKMLVPSHHSRRREYRFDGTSLRAVSDHDQVRRCHHCGTSRCREL